MRNIYAVWEREMGTYFTSPIAYVVMAIFLVIFGWFFNFYVVYFTTQGLNPMWQSQLNLDEMVVKPLFGTISFITLLVTPALTMRLFAEERKMGTFELIYTSPISKVEWVLGKFAACGTLFIFMILLTAYAPMILLSYGNPDLWPMLSAYAGLILMGLAFISFGILASSLTENQIIAAVITVGGLLLLWLLAAAGSFMESEWGQVLAYTSVITHFDDFNNGVLDTRRLIYYASFILFFLTATVKVLDSHSWR